MSRPGRRSSDRKATAIATADGLLQTGVALSEWGAGAAGDAVRAMGSLLRMAGELGGAASRMLSGKEHYAGAALLRQVVEIEYLTWTFKEGQEAIVEWLNSDRHERRERFSPARLRKNAKGRFLAEDYQNHCEQGGHPVPRGIPLLGGQNIGSAQILLVDLLTHEWRTWDQVRAWLRSLSDEEKPVLPVGTSEISFRLKRWSERDPVYALMVEKAPEPKGAV
jgi:hypothetical protein